MDADPLYPAGYHPVKTRRESNGKSWAKPFTRSQRLTKYHFVDFGLSHRFGSFEARHKLFPICGGDKSVPEFKNGGNGILQDPLPTDIYYLGNMMRNLCMCVLQVFRLLLD